MRFGIVHRVMTDALATLGILAVVSTTSMSPWTNGVLLVGLVLALAIPESWQVKPSLRHFSNAAPVALFVAQLVRLLAGRPPLDVAIEFAALLQIIRLATRRGAAHDQQIIVLSLLHFVAGTVLGGGLTYGLCFLGFLVVAPGALVLSHLRREVEGNYRQGARDRTGHPVDVPRILRSRRVVGRTFLLSTCLLSVPIFLFTAALFVLFPRVGLSLLLLNHPHSGHMIGFSDHVDLGQVGVLRDDPSIALRFEVSGLPDPAPARMTLRLRGTAFDSYDGHAWGRTTKWSQPAEHVRDSPDTYALPRAPDPNHERKISFDLEPIDPPVVFLPPRTVGVHVKPQNQTLLGEPVVLLRGPEGELRYSGPDARGLHYDAYVDTGPDLLGEHLADGDRARYLEVPSALPARVGELAETWTADLPNDYARAHAIEEHLRKDYRYDITSPSGGKEQPIDHFLFESRRGHCEFFSSAMAIMLRQMKIPSRNVTGFVGGTYNRFGRYYAVREGDAHSWVEGYIGDAANGTWVTFDPTPPAGAQPLEATTGLIVYMRDIAEALSQQWSQHVVNYNLGQQVRMFDDVARRYETLRRKTGMNHGPLDRITSVPGIAGLVLLGFVVAYWVWRRSRAWGGRERKKADTLLDPRLGDAAELYRALEGALAVQGLSRPAALPPLRHAELIVARKHPLGQEALALTSIYIEARFGHAELTESSKRDFEQRVKQLRSFRPPAAEA